MTTYTTDPTEIISALRAERFGLATAAADLIESQAAEIARLREALVSFAEASKMLPSALADHEFLTLFNDASLDAECILGDYDASPITAGDLRRAADVLKGGAKYAGKWAWWGC
jgi:hypothetical protein